MDDVDLSIEQLLGDIFIDPPVSPTEANFKGEFTTGTQFNRCTVKLKRGRCLPHEHQIAHLRNQLIWVMPEDEEPILMWCDPGGKLYRLKFYPYTLHPQP